MTSTTSVPPQGLTSCQQFGGYHNGTAVGGVNVAYAAIFSPERVVSNGELAPSNPLQGGASLGLLGLYALVAGGVLAVRLKAEYRGENLGSGEGAVRDDDALHARGREMPR